MEQTGTIWSKQALFNFSGVWEGQEHSSVNMNNLCHIWSSLNGIYSKIFGALNRINYSLEKLFGATSIPQSAWPVTIPAGRFWEPLVQNILFGRCLSRINA